MGSSRTMSRTCLVNLANSRSITPSISSRGSIMRAKTSSPPIRSLARTTKSFRAGVPSLRPVSRKMARTTFSIDRISLRTVRRATRSERQDRHVDVITCTARNQPVLIIWAMARASLRSILSSMAPTSSPAKYFMAALSRCSWRFDTDPVLTSRQEQPPASHLGSARQRPQSPHLTQKTTNARVV
jgi:hypothetical protein